MKLLLFISIFVLISKIGFAQDVRKGSWQTLIEETEGLGKKEWSPMLKYVAGLHEKSTHPPVWPFRKDWEEIGPGYVYGPAFGHWDIIHQVIDVLPSFPSHARNQLENNIENQEAWGMIPGSFWMPGSVWSRNDTATWSKNLQGHPPFWVIAVEDYVKATNDKSAFSYFYTALIRQIAWFENARRAEGEGYFYNDIFTKKWESGVDEGVRFDGIGLGKWACIDATCHVYLLYKTACQWQEALGLYDPVAQRRKSALERFITTALYDKKSGRFFDMWAIKEDKFKTLAFETFFPLVVGVATQRQANRLIDEYLLDTANFLLTHPVPTVGRKDPKFELRMWRGPAWNSMTYWIARGCLNYNRPEVAKIILERALDNSAKHYTGTGTIWEFYDPFGGDPRHLKRKKGKHDQPCPDYLGHNPLIAMARMFAAIKGTAEKK